MPDPIPVPAATLGQPSQQGLNQITQQPSAQPGSRTPALASNSMPNIVRFITGMINPAKLEQPGMARPPSRLDVFENFLGNFMGAMGQGFANQGTGPGSFARGLGGALQYPQAQAQRQAEVAKTQAESEESQQRGQFYGAQAQNASGSTYVPGFGMVNNQLAGKVAPAAIAGQSREQVAQTNVAGRMSVEQMKMNILMGKVARVETGKDQSGNLVKIAYNQQGQQIGTLEGALPSASYLPTATQTTEFKEDSNGNIIALPKASTRGKVIPGQLGQPQAGPTPSGFPKPQASASSQGSGFPKPQATQGGPRVVALGKGAADAGTAINPQTNELIGTTRNEAAQNGYTNFTKATAGDFTKWRTAQMQFNDVQANVSRYTSAATRFAKEGKASDGPAIDTIINKSGIFDMQLKIGEGGDVKLPAVSALLEAASRQSRSAAYRSLSPAGKDLIDGYFRTMAALPAYQRAITMSGKSSDHQMDLEIPQIANPSMAPEDILRKMTAFQENIDQGVVGIPKMKGMPTTKDVRQKFEGTGSAPTSNYGSQFLKP